MGILEKSFLPEFQNKENFSPKLPGFDILDFPHRLDSLLNSAEYWVLAEYLNFFSNIDNLESVMTNENI